MPGPDARLTATPAGGSRHGRWVTVAAIAAIAALGATTQAQQAPPQAAPPPTSSSRVAHAGAVVDLLVAQEFAKVIAQFDETMKLALSEESLRSGWTTLLAQAGKFGRCDGSREEQRGAFTAVIATCDFEKATIDFTVVFDAEGRIAGLRSGLHAPPVSYSPPAYAVEGAYAEREVIVGEGEWALPGTLTLPAGDGRSAAVVLVHGSGPNDRDETLGPNKMFKDLALGLASKGVAVLRYDKRTLVHRVKLDGVTQFTVKEETTDDALAAVALLRALPQIDPARIFVAGHSLGGMVAPRIAAADPKIAGLIIMAGAVRPLELAILDQFQYLASADGTISTEEQKAIDEAHQTVAAVAALTAADAASGRYIVGAPVSYWLDLRGIDPPAEAAKLPQRLLVLQGGRDYQVTVADFERWQAALKPRPAAEFRLYPPLNHLFLPGSGPSLPAEYYTPGHVPVEVINDIVEWIRR